VVSPDGVEPSQIVCVSASVNLPLRHKVQKFSSGTSSPGGGPGKRAVKQLWCGVVVLAKRLAGKSISEMTCFVSSGM